jgi:hypothetical protein
MRIVTTPGRGALFGLILAGGACSRHGSAPVSQTAVTRTDSTQSAWHSLFDGHSAHQWRAYRGDSLPAGWQVVDGALTRVGQAGDIITREEFQDFELVLEWKVEPGVNSGILYRVAAGPELETVWQSGPEFQVLDDARHPDGRRPETSAGACYGLYPATRGVVRPAGEWNEARIVVQGAQVEHWLNGQRVVRYELGSRDWEDRVRASKFASMLRYGREPRGHIALQDHGDWVAFRNIRIRSFPDH